MTLKLIGAAALALALSVVTAEARLADFPLIDRHSVREYVAPSMPYRARTGHQHRKTKSVRKFTVPGILIITKRPAAEQPAIPLPRARPAEPTLQVALLRRARAYLGTNPTGWQSLWCGRFLAMIAPHAARRIPNPNFARNWERLPHITAQIGAIVVLSRGGGGHVGIVMGFSKRGVIVISGNHGHRVGIGTYDRRRVIAYVQA